MDYDLNLWQMEDNLNIPTPTPTGDDAFPNLTEGWLSYSKICY